MYNLDQHIEFLLLKHDCVIVPGFGGFVVHHIAAQFDKRDGMMLPPKYTVGFNPQLVINDSLLIQSYIDAYDMSYPEAQRQVENEANELRQRIEQFEEYEISGVGRFTINKGGNYEFHPLESGINVPKFYALSGIDTTDDAHFLSKEELAETATTAEEDDEKDFIRISTTTLKNLAAACAVIALLLCIPILSHNTKTRQLLSSIDTSFFTRLLPSDQIKTQAPAARKTVYLYASKPQPAASAEAPAQEASEQSATAPAESQAQPEQPQEYYTVVLAARISQANAEAYAQQLQNRGMENINITGEGKNRKLVCGTYSTEEEAQNKRRELAEQKEFATAWVTQIK